MLHIDKNDPNRNFFLNHYKSIVLVGNEYCLQATYKEDENENVVETFEYKNNLTQNEYTKNCGRCIHYIELCGTNECVVRTFLENCPANSFIPSGWVANCDAYEPIFPLNIIKSENEMIDFIEKTENFFGCPEDYGEYFGFERNWDEETGDILESVKEYYTRGGKFKYIPDKYPCVIYFGIADFDGMRGRNKKLDWIYIGEDAV